MSKGRGTSRYNMPSRLMNPALSALAGEVRDELVFAEVLLQKSDGKFSLRHVSDQKKPLSELKSVSVSEIRKLAQFDSVGAFRPLLSAPTLVAGWIVSALDLSGLDFALNQLYPGAVADWFTARSAQPPITSYREFTGRQTGMYRIAAMLDDHAVVGVIRECCAKKLCLKRRLWSVTGLPSDEAGAKSIIPCLEPCAIMLELARKTARIVLDKQAAEVKA